MAQDTNAVALSPSERRRRAAMLRAQQEAAYARMTPAEREAAQREDRLSLLSAPDARPNGRTRRPESGVLGADQQRVADQQFLFDEQQKELDKLLRLEGPGWTAGAGQSAERNRRAERDRELARFYGLPISDVGLRLYARPSAAAGASELASIERQVLGREQIDVKKRRRRPVPVQSNVFTAGQTSVLGG